MLRPRNLCLLSLPRLRLARCLMPTSKLRVAAARHRQLHAACADLDGIWAVKHHRQLGIHVTPTCRVNGITTTDTSSSWSKAEWAAFLDPLLK